MRHGVGRVVGQHPAGSVSSAEPSDELTRADVVPLDPSRVTCNPCLQLSLQADDGYTIQLIIAISTYLPTVVSR